MNMKRVGLFLPESTWGSIDGSAMNKGLGGRETALVALALEFAHVGVEVYAFVPRGEDGIAREGNVRWIPNGYVIEMAVALDLDLFVSWENTQVLDELKAASFDGITAIEMQVAHLESHDPEVKVSDVADFVCVLSEWASEFFVEQHPDCSGRMVVLPNGIDMARFKLAHAHAVEHKHPSADDSDFHFIYSSSPDRGLHHLLAMWPAICDRIMSEYQTGCHLHICYGVENFIDHNRWDHRENGLRAREIVRLIEQPNIIYHGKIGQDELAALMIDCDLMLYPCDTMSPTETGCISICEALAAGTPVVTTDCDCIGPDYGGVTHQVPLPFGLPTLEATYLAYIEEIMEALNPEDYDACAAAGKEFVERRDWAVIATNWLVFFDGVMREQVAA